MTFPAMTFSSAAKVLPTGGRTITRPPERPLPT
jgi:hypothetical protein